MIREHCIYCALISIIITSAPPQITRHQILESGDPWGEGTQEDCSAIWLAVLGFMVMGLVLW